MKNLILILSLVISSVSWSAESETPEKWGADLSSACKSNQTDVEISECLNGKLEALMRGPMNDLYLTKMRQLLSRQGIESFNTEELNLYNLYPVKFQTTDQFGKSQSCVNFDKSRSRINEAAAVAVDSALFAIRFATLAFGRPISPVLGFYEINVCESKRMLKLNREKLSLDVGFQFKIFRDQKTTAKALWNEWQEGDAVNPRPDEKRSLAKQLLKKLNYIGLDKNELLDEALYQRWEYLNPTGEVRRLLRTLAWKGMDALFDSAQTEGLSGFLDAQIAKLPAKYKSLAGNMNDSQKRQVADAVLKRIARPDFLQRVIAAHVAKSEGSCTSSTQTTLARNVEGGLFAMANAKPISINVNFGFPYPVFDEVTKTLYSTPDKECSQSTLELRDNIKGLIALDLVDHVHVTVVGLSRLTDAIFLMPQVALVEILQGKNQKK